uniref:IMD domain-containing protein n=1 Tax=Panagrellus redivivus TaxID=6233 RepID=A0A7E4VGG6_PANRE
MAVEVEAPAFPALFQAVAGDLKTSSQAWDSIVKSAAKVATQLLNTAASMNTMIDCIQVIGDSANNIKGASRDIGASLTRFCMRQRSIESHLRKLATALNTDFCDAMDKKGDEWKKHVSEIERRRGKCFKKSSKKKYLNNEELLADQRESCLELMFEQRKQFGYFVNAFMPVMDIEVDLLMEGELVKQARDAMYDMVHVTDPHAVVYASMEDFCMNSIERRMISPAGSIISSATSGGLDRTVSPSVPSIDSFYSLSRNSTVSNGTNPYAHVGQRQIPTAGSVFGGNHASPKQRPPIPRGPNGSNWHDMSPVHHRGSIASSFAPASSVSGSSNDISTAPHRRSRPLSFSGDSAFSNALSTPYNDSTLKATTPATTSVSEDRVSNAQFTEAIQQIDELSKTLDSYCMGLGDASSGNGSSVTASEGGDRYSPSGTPLATPPQFPNADLPPPPPQLLSMNNGTGTIRSRNMPPPPLPERRNSTIQTTMAPSIADFRSEYATVNFREMPKPNPNYTWQQSSAYSQH